jgi:hypothetical protein
MVSGKACALLCLLSVVTFALAENDVVTCGGFVQASSSLAQHMSTKLDYSIVKMYLFTSDGLLKYSTECAPNGYFFIPVYDKGAFTLQVEGPAGWNFEPKEHSFVVDDKQSGCSDDINFRFTGFSVRGRVASDHASDCASVASGPAGVHVTLAASGVVVASAESTADGVFQINNVFPGSYDLVASHPSYRLEAATQAVEVSFGNSELATPVRVRGYRLGGTVVAGDAPQAGVQVFLYAANAGATRPAGSVDCEAPPAAASSLPARAAGATQTPLCVALTDAQGQFSFASLPCGQYELAATHARGAAVYTVAPADLRVEVAHQHVQLPQAFAVTGFTASGRVVDKQGQPVAGAAVLVNDVQRATTGADGTYSLALSPGRFSLRASKQGMTFHALKNLELGLAATAIPDITVTG